MKLIEIFIRAKSLSRITLTLAGVLIAGQLFAQTNTATVTRPAGLLLTCVPGPAGVGLSYATTGTNPNATACSATDVDTKTTIIKTASPAAGSPVAVGGVITYTLTSTVTGGATTAVQTLTDTLGTGLSFGAIGANPGGYTCTTAGSVVTCTLPIGKAAGSYSVSYTATVTAAATTSVSNSVVPSGGPTCVAASDCTVNNPVTKTTIIKTASPAAGSPVAVGGVITYTLTSTVTGGATTAVQTLTDTLGTGLSFGAIGANPGGYTCTTAGSVVTCTLPIGKAAGSYSVSYTATVTAAATTSVSNSVVPSGGPTCVAASDCTVNNPVTKTTIIKTASPAAGSPVAVGGVITYTLTSTVTGGATTAVQTLTDTLGTGLSFGAIGANPGGYTCTTAGSVVTCTLPIGKAAGSYSVSYTATVTAAATTSVSNSVVPSGGPTCVAASDCTVNNPVTKTTIIKTASPAAGSPVAVGGVITYTLTSTVTGGATTAVQTLTDTLGTGLSFGAIGANPGGYTCTTAGSVVTCTLPIGKAAGSYSVSYTATVTAAATTSVSNSVVPSGGPTCVAASDCTVNNPVTKTTIIKTASPAAGSPVAVGGVITYTLTSTVTGGATTAVQTLTDTLGTGLSFGAIGANPGGYTCTTAGSVVTCTLPIGKAAGSYSVSYTATVTAAATTSVSNSVVPSGGPTCVAASDCTVNNPVTKTTIIKTASPAAGSPVAVGGVITYTLTSTVTGGATTAVQTLTDTLGTGLSFGAIGANPGGYTCTTAGSVVTCTLPIGKAAGSYSVSYTATVTAAATTSVSNSVVPSGGPTCVAASDCTVNNPVTKTTIIKTASPAAGSPVAVGGVITYTLTSTVTGGATTAVQTLTDTLGTGLSFGAIGANPGGYTCTTAGSVVTCTLPIGKAAGSYSVSYTATVTAAATTSVSNSVVPSGGPTCVAASDCTVNNPVTKTTIIKTASPAAGSPVAVGGVITYTLTSTVTGGATTAVQTLTDTLGTGLSFGAIGANPGGYTCTTAGSVVTCTLPIGKAAGSYSVSYTATVTAAATTSVSNSVVPSGGPTCVAASDCTVNNPVTKTTIIKTASPAAGSPVAVGGVITYTLTSTVTGGATTAVQTLTDTLGTGLSFGAIGANPGGYTCTTAGSVVTCTLPIGKAAGSYSVSYTATVTAAATTSVSNSVVPSGGPTCVAASDCTVNNPVTKTTIIKTASPAAGSPVAVGGVITYTLTSTVTGGATTAVQTLTDTLGTGLSFGAIGANPGGYTCTTAGSVVTCTLPIGKAAGSYSVSYTATVTAAATTSVSNSVVPSGGPTCVAASDCTVNNPVTKTTIIKTASPAAGSPVAVGGTITYTLTSTVTGGATTAVQTLTDTLGTGLSFGAIGANPGGYTCTTAGSVVTCTLPIGKAAGSYSVSYTATVTAAATTSVSNSVVPSGGPTCVAASDCTVNNPVTKTTIIKTASPAAGSPVAVGGVITYTLTSTVTGGATTAVQTLTDTLGTGLSFGAIGANPGGYTCTTAGSVVTCTLPIGKAAGSYSVSYTATVTAAATTSVSNSVVPSGGPTCVAALTVR